MQGKKVEPYTWLYTEGGDEVPTTDSGDTRLVRDEKDAAALLRTIVGQIGLAAALRLLSEVAAECEGAGATKKGGKK